MCAYKYIFISPVRCDCRIHRLLHLCRGVSPLPPTSVLDMALDNMIVRLQPWRFGECGVLVITIAPRSTLARSGNT